MEKLKDQDFLSALVLLFVGTVAWSQTGSEVRDWIFPLLATYVILTIAVVLLFRVLFGAAIKRVPDLLQTEPGDSIVAIDLVVFCAIVLAFLFVMYGLGFWLASFLMLVLTSVYLTLEKTRKNLVLAVLVPLSACILAYVVFLHVFYVPLPQARWWMGLR